MNKYTLIIPFAKHQKECSYLIKEGGNIPLFIQSLNGLDEKYFDRICIALLKEDSKKYNIISSLQEGFKKSKWNIEPEFLEIKNKTSNQPETIANILQGLDIKDQFFVKDPDSFFNCGIIHGNNITVFPLDDLSMVNPQNKSYVSINDSDYIMNIAEKRIVGRYFCTGGYSFSNVDNYLNVFNELKHIGNLYLSHIIYKMLLNGDNFRPIYVSNYQDWGTFEDYKLFENKK